MDAVEFSIIVKRAEAKFDLKSTGKTYTLRKVNLLDESWMEERIGRSGPLAIISHANISEMIQIAYHQLVEKSEFLAEKIEDVDDDGIPKTIMVTGPQKLMAAIESAEECERLVDAVMKVIGLSRPAIIQLAEKVQEQNRELKASKKKNGKHAGPKFST